MTMSKGAEDAEIERYKAMIRNSNAYEDMQRSQEFVSPSSSPKKKAVHSPHKWGKPVSPEQFRPDDWLGTPASASKKSYKIKTLPNSLPIVDLVKDDSSLQNSSSSLNRDRENKQSGVPSLFHSGPSPQGAPKQNVRTVSDDTKSVNSAPADQQPSSSSLPSSPLKFPSKRPVSVGPGDAATAKNTVTTAKTVNGLQRRSISVTSPNPGSPTKKKYVPARIQSEGGKPGVPSMFAASLSPQSIKKGISKSPRTPTLPDPKRFIAMRDGGSSSSTASDVPAAFRSSLNQGIYRSSSQKDVVSKYGLSPAVPAKQKVPRRPNSVVSYSDMRKNFKRTSSTSDTSKAAENMQVPSAFKGVAARRMQFAKEARSNSQPHLGNPHMSPLGVVVRKKALKSSSVVSYSDMRKNLKRTSSTSDTSKAAEKMQVPSAFKGVATRRMQFAKQPRSNSQPHLGNPHMSPLGGGIKKKAPMRGRKSGSISPKGEKGTAVKSPKSPKRGSEANSPKPPSSPKRISAPDMGSGELPGLPFESSSPDVASNKPKRHTSTSVPSAAPSNQKQKTEEKSPISEKEKINKKKFVAAFVAFEETEGPPISSDPLSSSKPGKKGRRVPSKAVSMKSRTAPDLYPKQSKGKRRSKSVRSVSPTPTAPRNYKVSPLAKKKEAALSSQDSIDGSERANELANLKEIIAQLKKVKLPEIPTFKKNGDKSDEQASEIIEIMRNLRHVESGKSEMDEGSKTLTATMANLQNSGIIDFKIQDSEIEELENAQLRIKKVKKNLDDREFNYGRMKSAIAKLKKATTCKTDFLPKIEEAIGKLRKAIPNLYDDNKTETEDVIRCLEDLVARMTQREARELAGVIRSMKRQDLGASADGEGSDELARVISNLKSLCKTSGGERKPLLGANLNRDDADFLTAAIGRLKKVKLTDKEAQQCAGLIRNLKKVGDTFLSDGDISSFCKSMDSSDKGNEIEAVLKGLRRLNMSDREWDELADTITSLRKGSGASLPGEISDVIAGLKKAKINKKEAKEVAGIVVNLRKVNRGQRKPEEFEREMVKLRKVLPKEKSDDLCDMVYNLKDAELDESGEADLADAMADLGESSTAGTSPTSEKKSGLLAPPLISLSGDAENPEMILQVPADDKGPDEALGETLHWDRGVSYRGNDDDSDYEEASTSSEGGSLAEIAGESTAVGESTAADNDSDADDDDESIDVAKPEGLGLEPLGDSGSTDAEKKFHFSCPVIYEPDGLGNEELMEEPEEKHKKIVFNQKPKWIHKKHHNTVVGEKRWRFHEGFGADEVIFSPLSRDQYDRRKKISASIFANLGDDLPFSDGTDDKDTIESSYVSSRVEELMDRKEGTGRRTLDEKI